MLSFSTLKPVRTSATCHLLPCVYQLLDFQYPQTGSNLCNKPCGAWLQSTCNFQYPQTGSNLCNLTSGCGAADGQILSVPSNRGEPLKRVDRSLRNTGGRRYSDLNAIRAAVNSRRHHK